MGTSECLGADALMKLLKNYTRNANIKSSISVGVIGFPNVGKSSLINSLKRSKACNVGATPGVTKNTQASHARPHRLSGSANSQLFFSSFLFIYLGNHP